MSTNPAPGTTLNDLAEPLALSQAEICAECERPITEREPFRDCDDKPLCRNCAYEFIVDENAQLRAMLARKPLTLRQIAERLDREFPHHSACLTTESWCHRGPVYPGGKQLTTEISLGLLGAGSPMESVEAPTIDAAIAAMHAKLGRLSEQEIVA